MVNKLKIAPSTDPCKDKDDLFCYIKKLNNIADFLHCDVMDKNFVSRDTLNEEDIKQIYSRTLLPLDVHLMIREPSSLIKKYKNAGAHIITVHYEAFENKNKLIKCLKNIHKNKALAGISIKPKTAVSEIMPYLSYVDLVLVMSVEPGFSGQPFMENTYLKVKKLKQIREDYGANYKIEVDGGIVPEISKKLYVQGADIVVSGSYIYNSQDKFTAIQELKF